MPLNAMRMVGMPESSTMDPQVSHGVLILIPVLKSEDPKSAEDGDSTAVRMPRLRMAFHATVTKKELNF